MNLRSIFFALAVCVSTVSHTAHAVTCAANMTASNPDAAYTDHGDGTVTHVPTGLMWKRCSEGQSWDGSTCTGTATSHTWAGALALGSASSFAGHADWRLPNLKELRSLVEECSSYPAINDTIFPVTPSSRFWSGSPYAYPYGSNYAWVVNFGVGLASDYYDRSYSLGVRLVRGGQSFGSFDSSNGVALSATTLSFAAQNLGTTSAAQSVTLTNNGNTPLNIASIAASGNYAVAHNCGAGLGAGGFCTLNITFTPAATGTRTGAVTISDDSFFGTKTIALTGTGRGAVVSLNATALNFASQNQGTTSAAQTVTLTNTGVAVLNIAGIVASGDFARTTTCGATLAAGANCTISVTFRPTAAGARSGSIAITSNALSSPNTISLSGTGVAVPVVSLNPASLSFAAQAVGTGSPPKTIALTNTGGAALTLASIAASGDFAVTHNCGGGLGAGGFCNLSVTFTPTLAGARTGALTITSNAAGSPRNVNLSGTGGSGKLNQTIGTITFSPNTLAVGGTTTASATATSGLPVTFSTTSPACTATGTNGRTITGVAAGACIITANQAGNAGYNPAPLRAQTLTVGTLPTPAVSLNRTALTFSARRPGTTSPAQLVTLTNTGASALNITGIVASGNFARTTTCGTTLAAGASCIISVTFTPTAMGARTGLVTLTSNAPGSPHRIALAGTGQGTRYDLNGDGKADIFWRNTATGANQIWFMNGLAKTGIAAPLSQPAGWSIAAEADFNADGKADLLWRNAAGQNQIWLMNGAVRLSATILSPAVAVPWTFAGTGDFNNDGKADLFWRNTATGANQVWMMNGAARIGAPANTAAQAIAWTAAGVADFNGDGKADILWRNAATGQNQVWFMNGAARTGAQAVPGTILAPWIIAGTGDFNNDGRADLLWRNPVNGQNTVWFMNGAAATGTPTAAQAAIWQVAGVADFSGDGKADILWRNPASGATQLWLMNGAARGSFANLTPAMLVPWVVAK